MQGSDEHVRLRNLQQLLAEAGSVTELARRAATKESDIPPIPTQRRTHHSTPLNVNDELAEKLERAMGKPPGWIDETHYPPRETASPTDHNVAEPSPEVCSLHPLVTWEQVSQRGEAAGRLELADAQDFLPCPVPCSRDTFVLRVTDASIAPRFRVGDLIFVDPSATAQHGRFVVVLSLDDDRAALRRLIQEGGRSFLEALDPAWPNRIAEMENTEAIIGVVVFKGEVLR